MSILLHSRQSELRGQINEPLRMSDNKRIHSVRLDKLPTGELVITRANAIDFDRKETVFTCLPRGAITMRDSSREMFIGRRATGSFSIEDGVVTEFLFKLYEKLKKQDADNNRNGWIDESDVKGLLEMLSHLHRQAERNARVSAAAAR
jgi:hypothetical protein